MPSRFFQDREPPPGRRGKCTGGKERHLPEAAVMLAFALHLLERGATTVNVYPDGEHGKRFDIRACLEAHGFRFHSPQGKTLYGGTYERGKEQIIVRPKSGEGDVVADVHRQRIIAECKGGIVNSKHAGQLSRLRRGLCEAVGLLMSRPSLGERHIAVAPKTRCTEGLAKGMAPRVNAAGIEIALVDEAGDVCFVPTGISGHPRSCR